MKGELALLLKALTFAARKHRDQRRKDARASPYINHPIALADVLVNEAGVTDVEVLCAALLHDTIEDTETTPGELEREFGRDIADIVAELTDNKMLRKRTRKRMQIAHAAATGGARRGGGGGGGGGKGGRTSPTRSATCATSPRGPRRTGASSGGV